MADPRVREIGRVADMDGVNLVVGVDYDAVTLGYEHLEKFCLTQAQAEEFAHLFVSAVWQAGQQAGYSRGRGDEAAGAEVPGG